ncbi:MAG: N-acetylmuramoyl-L-alanine amidase [Alphaproteobacteria bacterium]|nr:N-acetylmuramoyl-L-alanine amidase [Alphaproteobacteria bacterium]
MNIVDTPSQNFEPRRNGMTPRILILHYTEYPTGAAWLEAALPPESKVSAHYMIDYDGTVHRMVDESMRAWHAGVSHWEGETDINSLSVGIEIQNDGKEPYPDTQLDTLTALCTDIITRHGILPRHVLAHSDIAPTRKPDPGPHFPWVRLAKDGIGLWVDAHKKNAQPLEHPEDIMPLLVEYGYDPAVDIKTLVAAFQRHFEPDVILKTPAHAGVPTTNTVHILQNLLKQAGA